MKTYYYYALCITMSFLSAQAMDHTTTSNVRVAASACAIIGGWGFFVANSPRITNKLPTIAKRAPLALFLVGCSINQGFIIKENIKNIRKDHE